MFKLLFILLTILYLNSFCQDSLIFIIRVDDIQSRNTTTIPRSIKPFQNAVSLRGGKVSWAIIPHRLIETQNYDGVLSKELRESLVEGHDFVLHGYNHICTKCGESGHEMFCSKNNQKIDYLAQRQLILDGLKIFQDTLKVLPKTFVPPGHQADTTTYNVLLENNINYISTIGGTKLYLHKNLFNLQQNNEFTWSMTNSNYYTQLNSAINEIKNIGKANGYYCLLLHDPFIRSGYDNAIVVRWTGELLDSLNHIFGNKIKYYTLTNASKVFKDLLTSVNSNSFSDLSFSLSQNYPNPFNSGTAIDFALDRNANVEFKIYDILGKEIMTLIEQKIEKGTHTMRIDFSDDNLPSGVYLYKLKADNIIQIKKMIYLR